MGTAAVSTGSAYVSVPSFSQRPIIALAKTQPVVDGILAIALLVHSHIGFDSCITDYLHERKFPVLGVVCKWLLRVGTGLGVWGVYEFNTNDIGACLSFQGFPLGVLTSGLTELVARLWKA